MTRAAFVNLMTRAGQMPSLLASFSIFLPQFAFCCGYYVAGAVIIFLVALSALLSHILKCKDAAAALVFSFVISILIAIPVIQNSFKNLDAPTGFGTFEISVSSSRSSLDGKRRIFGLTEGGVRISSVLEEGSADCYPTDLILIEGEMKMPSKATNPGEFDYKSYLERKGIARTVKSDDIKLLSGGRFFSKIQSFFEKARMSFIRAVISDMHPEDAAIAAALLFGDRSLLTDDMSRKLTLTGLNHLAAVSGTHFAGFLILFPYLVSFAGIKNRKITASVYIILCVLIGFLTSWTESVTRAAFMNICAYFGRDALSSMSIAAILMMLADPYSVVSQGFLMSYAASLALRFIVPGIRDKITALLIDLMKKTKWRKRCNHRFEIRLSKIVSVFAVCLGCTLVTCLFTESVEIRLGPFMVLINIAASFMVTFICASFIPVMICSLIVSLFTGDMAFSSISLSFMTAVFRSFVDKASGLSYSSFAVSCEPGYLITALAVVAILAILPQCLIKRLFFRISCLILCAVIGIHAADQIKYGAVKIIFLDVGQGDCALIMAGGKTALIDGGVADEGLKTLPVVLDHFNISKVDYAIMSHWDSDHVGGLLSLAKQGRLEKLYSPYTVCDEQVEEILRTVNGFDNTACHDFLTDMVVKIQRGDSFILSDDCRLDVISPENALSGENEDSAVIILDACGCKILFTGDIGMETEDLLAASGNLQDVDILKVAHHGSRFSTGEDFLNSIAAEYAVISVASKNYYGHPAPETLSRLEETDCRVYQTSLSGAVTVDTGLFGYRISEYVDEMGDGSG